MSRWQVGPHNVHYKKIGEGPPLVLIHGFGGSHFDWSSVAEILSQSFTVYLPYFARHYLDPEQPLTFSGLVKIGADVLETISHEHEQKVSIAGTSFGASLAWGLAIQHKERIDKLALVSPMPPNPALRLRDQRMKWLLRIARIPNGVLLLLSSPLAIFILPYLQDVFQLRWSQTETVRKVISMRLTKMVALSVQRFDWIIRHEDWNFWESRLSQIQAPTLILCGRKDPLFLPNEPERFRDLFQKAELEYLSEGRHGMSHESPENVAAALINFLQDPALKQKTAN